MIYDDYLSMNPQELLSRLSNKFSESIFETEKCFNDQNISAGIRSRKELREVLLMVKALRLHVAGFNKFIRENGKDNAKKIIQKGERSFVK